MKFLTRVTTACNCAYIISILGVCLLLIQPSYANDSNLSLEMAIQQAQSNDPWLAENQLTENAIQSRAIAAGTLPDPTASISIMNLPTDGFDFNQENMTQLNVGLSQMFPRGDTLRLQQQKLTILSRQNPFLREDRKAQIALKVTQLWLSVIQAKESIRLIEKDRGLFEQLLDISQASYASTFGGTQQQDIIRAQLELVRLEDRLTKLRQQENVAQQQLWQWVNGQFVEQYNQGITTTQSVSTINIDSQYRPDIRLRYPELMTLEESELADNLAQIFVKHPSTLALENQIQASETDIELSKQSYKSQWGLNAGYSYRADDQMGRSRADFLSFGVNFDLPLFPENKQDKQLQASVSEAEAMKTKKWFLLRKMIGDYQTAKVNYQRLQQRSELYKQKLLPQINDQAEAALTAYTNDEGDFAEVVRARIDVLDAEIANLEIDIDIQKTISQLNYFLVTSSAQDVSSIEGNE